MLLYQLYTFKFKDKAACPKPKLKIKINLKIFPLQNYKQSKFSFYFKFWRRERSFVFEHDRVQLFAMTLKPTLRVSRSGT